VKDRLWLFVIGSNLSLIVLIALIGIVYLKYVRPTSETPSTKTIVTAAAPVPKYVERIIEKHHYLPPSGARIEFLPKGELEAARPGSVTPEVLQDNTVQVVARSEVPPNAGPTMVDAIRKEADGTVTYRLDYRPLPRAFFDLKKEYHVGLYGGLGSNGGKLLEAEGRFLPLRVGPVELVARTRMGFDDKEGFYGAILFGVEH
jgi:hypothetical protein